jgi:hypothetical protein
MSGLSSILIDSSRVPPPGFSGAASGWPYFHGRHRQADEKSARLAGTDTVAVIDNGRRIRCHVLEA